MAAPGTVEPAVTLYFAPTPNGFKATAALEELGIPYRLHRLNLRENEQKQAWFLKINPNGRMPALVDHRLGDFAIFESGAILLHLAEQYGKGTPLELPADYKERSTILQWLLFQTGGQGPMQGQAFFFSQYASEKIPFAIDRYVNETRRLYGVLQLHLEATGHQYIANNRFSIADLMFVGWANIVKNVGVDLATEFPLVDAWLERVKSRPAVARGLTAPTDDQPKVFDVSPKREE